MLEGFASVIDDREEHLLDFVTTPRSIDEIVEHRFVCRPGQGGDLADQIEWRSMTFHLERLIRDKKVSLQEGGYRTIQALVREYK